MKTKWPDALTRSKPEDISTMLPDFWHELASLPDLLTSGELLLGAALTNRLRTIVLEMMLAMNGIAHPSGTRNLNAYLSDSQRHALEKTLLLPAATAESLIGQCVALVVIYHWYAPQLVDKYGVVYPQSLQDASLRRLTDNLPDWPRTITTEPA